MGEKTRARRNVIEAGVPVVPGTKEPIPHGGEEAAEDYALDDRLPGDAQGRGRRRRQGHAPGGAIRASSTPRWRTAKREAMTAFGDDAVYIEKYLDKPRHVEIQVFADTHGNMHPPGRARVLACSGATRRWSRRRPAAIVTPEMRAEMGEVAVKAAKAVDYVGAGTCEFLVDGNRNFYFLEMNTRLQVEHPVTELVTGLDLVALADSTSPRASKLPWTQDEVVAAARPRHRVRDLRGGSRRRNFMPSPGQIALPARAGRPGRARRLGRVRAATGAATSTTR